MSKSSYRSILAQVLLFYKIKKRSLSLHLAKAFYIIFCIIMSEKNSERNYGIDLLRMLSMLLVVMLHILGYGGVYDNCEPFSVNYYTSWFLVAAAKCAVNVFVMVTGYVMVGKKISPLKIIPLWLLVFFYSTLGILLFKFVPALNAICNPPLKEMVKWIVFPTMSRRYWYWTCYFGLFFFIPFFNEYIASIDKKTFRRLLLTIIVLFSLLPPFTTFFRTDSFNLERGFSPIWFMCMYFFGAYLRLYPPALTKRKAFAFYFVFVFAAWFAKFISHFLLEAVKSHGAFFGEVAGIVGQGSSELDLFIDYTSIFMVLSAAALLLLFSQIKIKGNVLKKIIFLGSRLSFSVFLIHCHGFFYVYIFGGKFSFISQKSPLVIVLLTILCSAGIFIACEFIDFFRFLLFKALRIEKIPNWLESKIKKESV